MKMNKNKQAFTAYGFPAYSGAQELCHQRVYTPDRRHLDWQAFTAIDAPTEVIAWYTKQLGTEGFEADGTGGVWRVPPDAPGRVIHVLPVAAPGPHQSCECAPPPDAQTVIIVSRMS